MIQSPAAAPAAAVSTRPCTWSNVGQVAFCSTHQSWFCPNSPTYS